MMLPPRPSACMCRNAARVVRKAPSRWTASSCRHLPKSNSSIGDTDWGKRGVRVNVVCPGFVRTPLVDKQIPEQARELGISEQEVIRNVMLKETVDGEFTTVEDVAETTLFLASFGSNALTGQSVVVSHGWHMQ